MIGQVLIQDRTVAVGWVKAIVAAAQRGGGDEAKMLIAAGIDSLPNDPLVRIPLDAVVRLWRAAIDSTGDSAFGLRMGQAIEPTSFDVVAYTLVSSNSLREAIIRLQRFQKLISDGGRVQLVERNGLEWMMYQSMEADPAVLAATGGSSAGLLSDADAMGYRRELCTCQNLHGARRHRSFIRLSRHPRVRARVSQPL